MSNNSSENEQDVLIRKAFCISRKYTFPASSLIPVLQRIQEDLGYIPRRAFEKVSVALKVPISHIFGVATFYHQFRLRPEGKHRITICKGTACHVGGADTNHLVLKRYLHLQSMEDTTEDSLFTLSEVRCIGACSLAPIIKIDDDIYGNVNPTQIPKILAKYRRN
jgi:NADH:ubiquinone oxidoreductase subunit E